MGRWSIWIEISSSISNFSLLNGSMSRWTGFCLHNSPIPQSNKLPSKNLFSRSCAHIHQEWASGLMFQRHQLLMNWLMKLPRLWRKPKTISKRLRIIWRPKWIRNLLRHQHMPLETSSGFWQTISTCHAYWRSSRSAGLAPIKSQK